MKTLLSLIIFFFSFIHSFSQTTLPDSLKGSEIENLINTIVKQRIDSIKNTKKKQPVIKTSLDFNGNISEGNVNRRLFNIGGEVSYNKKDGLLEYSITPKYTYGTQNSALREDDFITRFGFNVFQANRVYILGFGAIQTSHLRRISTRLESGGGVGFRFFKKKKDVKFSITNAIIYETTDFLDEESIDIETMSFSARFKGEYKIWKKHLTIKHVFFVQPSLLDRDYFRFIGNLQFKYKLNKNFDFNIILNDTYESIVAEGKVNNDFNILFGFSFHNF